MSWIFFALAASFLWATANILDNHLSNTLLKSPLVLTFYAYVMTLLFLPLVWLIQAPDVIPAHLIWAVAVSGLINVAYLYPYYKALQHDDTSTVSSLFSLGRFFIPLFAFFFIHEQLTATHYTGFFLITLSGALLSLNQIDGRLHWNRSFGYMLGASFILSIDAVIYKYILNEASWSTAFVWSNGLSMMWIFSLALLPTFRHELRADWRAFRQSRYVLGIEELFSLLAGMSSTYATALAPVTVVRGLSSLHPFFVLGLGFIFHRFFPHMVKENITWVSIRKKLLWFLVMAVGVWMIVE